jgi:hypothetical protein
MPALVAGIHVLLSLTPKTWMAAKFGDDDRIFEPGALARSPTR